MTRAAKPDGVDHQLPCAASLDAGRFDVDTTAFRVEPGTRVALADIASRQGRSAWKAPARLTLERLHLQLQGLQERMYAERRHALLLVLQAMDAAGKDSVIRRCFGQLNPQRCKTAGFRQPNRKERAHDFLWRIHAQTPPRGKITIFNRSHYEDVLVARVKGDVDAERWCRRIEHINQFEQMLSDEGTTVVKFYLHVSKDYQKHRLLRRIRRADKRWKFSYSDVRERKRWDDYMTVYEQVLSLTSTDCAPWFIVPSERRWFRDVVITQATTETLRALDPQLPQVDIDTSRIEL